MNLQCKEILKQPTTPIMEMEHIEIKEESHDNFLLEHQSWDEVKIKQEPEIEITIEDNTVQLPEEMAHFSLIDLMTAPHLVIKTDTEGRLIDVLHNGASPDSEMQLSLKVKPSSLPDSNISREHQYCTTIVKKRMCKNRKTSTIQTTGIQMSQHETKRTIKPFSQYDISSTTEKPLNCDKPYTCDTCHKCFSALYSLNRHKMLHKGIKPYICETCLKCFITLSDLKRHIRTHTGSKPYACDTCNRCFSDHSNLKSHIRIHTGSKPFTCDTCHKGWSTQCDLKAHTRTHTGSKPYTCDTCHKCFSDLSNMKIHKRIHTGSKPYTCDTCFKCFTTKSDLNRHNRIHTGSKPYSCDRCHKSFTQPGNLKTHKNTHKDQAVHL